MTVHVIYKLQIFLSICLLLSSCAESTETPTPGIPAAAVPSPTQPAVQAPTLPSGTPIPTAMPEATQTLPAEPHLPGEAPVLEIAIEGPLAKSNAEVSGMAWWDDLLLILPQYPENYLSENGFPTLFAVPKAKIIHYLEDSSPAPIDPIQVAVTNSMEARQVPGYEGFEAIATDGDNVYLTVEANFFGVMQGYIIHGSLRADGNAIDLDPASLTEIPTPVQLFNSTYETIISADGSVIALFEAFSEELNPKPEAMLLEVDSNEFSTIPVEHIKYRITDATGIDDDGRFWVLNIFMPIEFWYYTHSDPIIEQYGQGSSHAVNIQVERLLELKYNQDQISLSGRAPIYLDLDGAEEPRNWEGIVRLDGLGFLAATDTYPGTILAFIPYP